MSRKYEILNDNCVYNIIFFCFINNEFYIITKSIIILIMPVGVAQSILCSPTIQ